MHFPPKPTGGRGSAAALSCCFWSTTMKFVEFGGSFRSARGDRDIASSNSHLPRKERTLGDSRSSAAHVVFDPFVQSRRGRFVEGRVYTPDGV